MGTLTSCGKSIGFKVQDLCYSPGASGNFEYITQPQQTCLLNCAMRPLLFGLTFQFYNMLVCFLRLGSRHNQETHLCVPRCKLKVNRRPGVLNR